MKVFIVHAHPEQKSFCSALKEVAVERLLKDGHDVQISDLYEMNWNAVASKDDFSNPENPDYLVYALEQRNGYKKATIAKDIQQEVEKLLWADLLILNFPIFWFSTPAILKGWIDRVFLSGIIYGGKRFYDQGGMAGKKALVTCSLGGRDHMFGDGAIHGPLEDMLRHLLRGTLRYAGFDVLPPFKAFHVPYITEEARIKILEEYANYLSNLNTLEPLKFPRMDEFDDKLYPIIKK